MPRWFDDVWLVWICYFVVSELLAWFKERGHKSWILTFSRHVWKYFNTRWKRVVLVTFMQVVTFHLALGSNAWWRSGLAVFITGVPVFAIYLWGKFSYED